MLELKVDFSKDGIESATVSGQFDKAVSFLKSNGYGIVSLPINTHLRIVAGIKTPVTKKGNYLSHGFAYAKDAYPLFLRESPLVADPNLAELAVNANNQGMYFITDNDLYKRSLAIANDEKGIEPFKRRVLVLPSKEPFKLSGTDNPEIFEGIFGEHGREYLEFLEMDSLTFYPVKTDEINSERTLLTQMWFGKRHGPSRSNLCGNDIKLSSV